MTSLRLVWPIAICAVLVAAGCSKNSTKPNAVDTRPSIEVRGGLTVDSLWVFSSDDTTISLKAYWYVEGGVGYWTAQTGRLYYNANDTLRLHLQGWGVSGSFCPKEYERVYAPGDSIPMAIEADLWDDVSGRGVNITAIWSNRQTTWPLPNNPSQFGCP